MSTETTRTTPMDIKDKLRSDPTISVEDYAALMGIGRSLGYRLAEQNAIPGLIRLGRRLRVSSAAVLRMLEGTDERAAEQNDGAA
jgi:excisionase family DNA binding protein